MKPPNKGAALATRPGETLLWRSLRGRIAEIKPDQDPAVARFNCGLAAFFRRLREELKR